MKNTDHRHNPAAPLGLVLLKFAVGVGAAIAKKKLLDKFAPPPASPPPDRKK